MIYGLTYLGVLHTIISLVAVAAGLIAFFRTGEITSRNTLGQVYIWTTVITCVTGFGIFQHGGFGKPHVLGIATLVVLGVAGLAGRGKLFGRFAPYVETVSYSVTFFFHLIPGITESTTRLPYGSPLFSGPDDPRLQPFVGAAAVLLLVGATLQVMRMRGRMRATQPA